MIDKDTDYVITSTYMLNMSRCARGWGKQAGQGAVIEGGRNSKAEGCWVCGREHVGLGRHEFFQTPFHSNPHMTLLVVILSPPAKVCSLALLAPAAPPLLAHTFFPLFFLLTQSQSKDLAGPWRPRLPSAQGSWWKAS